MESNTTHTPVPWAKDWGGTKGHIKSIAPNERDTTKTVARYSGFSGIEICKALSQEEKEANAEFIVEACNNYDKLKEDNDLLLTILKRVKDVLRLQSGSKNFSDEFEQEIKEAILKVESK